MIGLFVFVLLFISLFPVSCLKIVQLVKGSREKPVTLAIGDGANDCGMIQEAHVGIGVMGKEGRQAVRTSDYAIARFKFLWRVLLVHGHWYYVRASIMVQYFFYKVKVLLHSSRFSLRPLVRLGFINRVDSVIWPPKRDSLADIWSVSPW